MSQADLPKPDVMAVGHKPKGSEGLFLGDLGDVVPELFVGLARMARASLSFHNGEHVAACIVQAIVGDAVPWLCVIAINWNLQSDLGAVAEFPVSSAQLRVDLQGAGLCFVESHGVRCRLIAHRGVKWRGIRNILYLKRCTKDGQSSIARLH